MKKKRLEEVKPHSINLLLLGVSLTILGVLGLIFITQMEVQPGWSIELHSGYGADYEMLNGSDITGDIIFDVLCYSHSSYFDERLTQSTPQFGSMTMLNGATGGKLWENLYDGPIKRAFRIFDVDSDGYLDFFACKAKVEPEWANNNRAEVINNNFSNFLLSGDNGLPIEVEHGIDKTSFSNYFTMDLVYLDDLEDEREDIICLEYIYNNVSSYCVNITSYFVNGTKVNYTNIIAHEPDFESNNILPQIELFSYKGETHLLLVEVDYVQLINLSTSDYSRDIYKADIYSDWSIGIDSYEIIEDLDLNGVPEIMISESSGSMIVINGTDGTYLTTYNTSYSFSSYEGKALELSSENLDGTTYVVSIANGDSTAVAICKVTSTSIDLLWEIVLGETGFGGFALDTDLNGDNIADVVIQHSIMPFGSLSYVRRYSFVNALNGQEFWQINTDRQLRSAIVSSDIDGDGLLDIVGAEGSYLIAFSVAKPVDLWLSAKYSYGMLLFIALVAFLIIGILLLVRFGTKLRFNIRKSFKENKMTVAVNAITIIVMTITFVLFMFLINIFNSTLIAEAPMTRIIVAFLTVSIMWYALLPLTAAIYNQFAPRFAYFIIKLRELFFKISKSYEHDILILDMGDRKNINNLIKIKRVILPTLLSITVGFLVYGYAAPIFGYAQNFTQFGTTQFFSFIAGYSLFCTFPLILSFSIFSFFIAGNYLLDDAGVVYYRESNKNRSPGDIEPISIWAQSIIKGFAGLSALITFSTFFATVDFSGFFTLGEQGIFFVIFGAFMVITMFWGNPFITSFSYILLAEEVMELSINTNVKKLHKIMEKKGYDIKPRKLTQLYPTGFVSSKKANTIDSNLTEDN